MQPLGGQGQPLTLSQAHWSVTGQTEAVGMLARKSESGAVFVTFLTAITKYLINAVSGTKRLLCPTVGGDAVLRGGEGLAVRS